MTEKQVQNELNLTDKTIEDLEKMLDNLLKTLDFPMLSKDQRATLTNSYLTIAKELETRKTR